MKTIRNLTTLLLSTLLIISTTALFSQEINIGFQDSIKSTVLNKTRKTIVKVPYIRKLVSPDYHKNGEFSTKTGIKNLKSRLGFLDKDFQFRLIEEDNKVISSVILTV